MSSQEEAGRARESVARLFRTHTVPTVLIIGAQKAGTTSLASYLSMHPCVISPRWKEVHFFDLNYSKGVEWYRQHFPIGARRRMANRLHRRGASAVDATPYYLLHPRAASRASSLMPGSRIIVLLRDPVARAYSHFHHETRLGNEHLSFEEAIEAEPSRTAGEAQRLEAEATYESFNYQHFTYLERGIYSSQIRRWLSYFRPEQFLILSSEEFFERPALAYKTVLKFLGLPFWEPAAYRAELVGGYPPLAGRMRDRLAEYYAAHNRTLRHYLNSHWPGVGDRVVDRFAA